jgi:hypothetical protein
MISPHFEVGQPGADIDEFAGHRSGGRHFRADQVGASALALASFEIAVGGGGAALPGTQLVRVHAQAHTAPGIAPFGSGGLENAVQAFGFGLFPHGMGARHHQ